MTERRGAHWAYVTESVSIRTANGSPYDWFIRLSRQILICLQIIYNIVSFVYKIVTIIDSLFFL